MRIFISSTRAGLEEERDSLPGLITALGHDPVVFEQFTAQAKPSREACVTAVQSADAYLLLLGPSYGWEWEETGLSATHEEYRAARVRGIPRVAFRKLGVDLEEKQKAFVAEVEAYASGLFRASYRTTAELLVEVTKAIKQLEQGSKPLSWRRLPEPIDISWRRDALGGGRIGWSGSDSVLEVYVRPTVTSSRTATQLREDAQNIAGTIRSLKVVDQGRPLGAQSNAVHAKVEVGLAAESGRLWNEATKREVLGVEVDHDGQVCIWQSLPRDHMGTLVDEASLTAAAQDALRLAGQLAVVRDPEVVLAASIHPLQWVNVGDPSRMGNRSQASVPTYGAEEIRTSTADAVTSTALNAGVPEAARELSLRILDALQRARR